MLIRLIFGRVDINFCNLFELRSKFVTRAHPYKIFKRLCTARSPFFSERVTDTWNSSLSDVVDFSSLASFKCSIKSIDFKIP